MIHRFVDLPSSILLLGPPITAYEGSALDGDPQVFRAFQDAPPGVLSAVTNFSGFTQADQCMNPTLSPDGTKIIFEVLSSTTGFREVWVVNNRPHSTPTQLVADASNYCLHPAWGADSDTFVYVKGASGATTGGTIYKDTVSAVGSPTALKSASGGFSPFRPQFNFDGTRVAYVFDKDLGSGGDLRVMDDDGANDASLDSALIGYRINQPPQFSWANTQNLIAYDDGASGSNALYVIADDGTGKTQINSAGDAAGASSRISGMAWPADDSFVVCSALILHTFYDVVRAELDGSDTSSLNSSHGPVNQSYYQSAVVFGDRIWFIDSTDASGSQGKLSSMALDGTDYTNNFDSASGTGDQVSAFSNTGGDGFYWN